MLHFVVVMNYDVVYFDWEGCVCVCVCLFRGGKWGAGGGGGGWVVD